MPLYLLGIFNEAVQHSRVPWRYGMFYPIVVSPAFHSVHHSIDPSQHHRNFGGLLSIWDTLFGTAAPDDRRAVVQFGLPDLAPRTLFDTLIAPFRLLHQYYRVDPARGR